MPIKQVKPAGSPEASAFRLLGRRDYSRQELLRKLTGKGFLAGEVERVLVKFESLGLLDDRKLARRLVDYYSGEKLWGPQKVFQKLVQRGIPAECARDLIDGEEENGKASERLRKILHLKSKGQDLRSLSPPEKRRLANYLRQRGYGWNDIWEALQEIGGSVEE
ncbi:MAG TPA: regulatory protein RecX [Thermodesulfobacteriota bacterium]